MVPVFRGKMKGCIVLLLMMIILPAPLFALSLFGQLLNLPPVPAPEMYGEIIMDKNSANKEIGLVRFSHSKHRVKYTCRVCHYELDFAMKSGETSFVCDQGRMNGKYCAVCHDGKISFGPRDGDKYNCRKCHGAGANSSGTKFAELQGRLPRTKFGDEIDWARAMENGLIKPEDTLSGKKKEMVNIKTLTLRAEWSGISSAIFPHLTHERWLDCAICHPDLFNIKKKTTATLRMSNMVNGESCGLCHLRVAFPLDDCRRCHPDMNGSY